MDIHFCKDCNNMLYPKEDKSQNILFLSCRNCEYFEESTSPIIYNNVITRNAEITMSSLSKDLITDKTLPRTKNIECPKCSCFDAVYFQTKDRQEEILMIYFVCCVCEAMWSNNKMK